MPASDFNAGPTQGMGSGTVKVSPIKKNTGSSDKVAYLKVTIAGQSPKFIKLTQQTGDYVYEYEFVAINNIINFGANGGTRQATITSTRKSYMDGQLVSTEDWPFSVKEHDEGLQVDGINITMPENTSSMPGVKQVIYVQQDSGKEVVIECNQLGASVEEDIIFEVTPQSLNFEEGASTQSVTVTSQSIKVVNEGEQQVEDIPYTASPSASWITATGNQIGVTANPNTSVRSGTVTFTQEGTNTSIVVTINQAAHVEVPGEKYFLFSELSPDLSTRPTVQGLDLSYSSASDQKLSDKVYGFKVPTLDGKVVVGDSDWSWEQWKTLIQTSTDSISPLSSSDYNWSGFDDWISQGGSYKPDEDISALEPYLLSMYSIGISANNTLNKRTGSITISVPNSDKGSISYEINQLSSTTIGFADTNTTSVNMEFNPGYDYTEESPEVQEQRFEILAYDKDTGERINLNGNLETYFTLNDLSSDLMNYINISLSNNFLVVKPKTTGTYKLLSTYAGGNGTIAYFIYLNLKGTLNVKGSSLTLNFTFTNNTAKNTNQIVYLTDTTGSSNKGTDLDSGQIHRNTQVTINTYVRVKRSLITNDNAFSFVENISSSSPGNLFPGTSFFNPRNLGTVVVNIDGLITYNTCELHNTLSNGDLIYHLTVVVNTHHISDDKWNGDGSLGSLALKGLQIRVGLTYKGMRNTILFLAKEFLTFVD